MLFSNVRIQFDLLKFLHGFGSGQGKKIPAAVAGKREVFFEMHR